MPKRSRNRSSSLLVRQKRSKYTHPKNDNLNDFNSLNNSTSGSNKDNNNNSPNSINDNTCYLVNDDVSSVKSTESNKDDHVPLVKEDLNAEVNYKKNVYTRNF